MTSIVFIVMMIFIYKDISFSQLSDDFIYQVLGSKDVLLLFVITTTNVVYTTMNLDYSPCWVPDEKDGPSTNDLPNT